jgi:hypothetical protein
MPGIPCIAGVPKIADATATVFRPQWRHGPQRITVRASPSYAQDRSRRSGDPLCRDRCDRRAAVARGVRSVVVAGPKLATRPVRRPRWTRLMVSFPAGRRSRCSTRRYRRWGGSIRISSMPCVGRVGRRSRRRLASGQQRLAVARVSAAVVAGRRRRAAAAPCSTAAGNPKKDGPVSATRTNYSDSRTILPSLPPAAKRS